MEIGELIIMKNKHSYAIALLIINMICAVFMILFAFRHPRWETVQLPPDALRLYYERLLHILCDKVLPSAAIVMAISAFSFWRLRK